MRENPWYPVIIMLDERGYPHLEAILTVALCGKLMMRHRRELIQRG